MSQNDFNLANQGFPTMRSDMNSAFQALASNSSGATAPSITYAYQWWYDTCTNILKMRNSNNDAWISISFFDQTADAFRILDDTQVVNTSGTQTGLIGDQATATWETGTGTTESLVSPAKVKAAIDALASGGGFTYDAVSGATQDLDVGSFNFFDGGTPTTNITIAFSNVPTEARWTWTAEANTLYQPYDVNYLTYSGTSFQLSTVERDGLFFKSDGTVMYILNRISEIVEQYDLSTAWDITTATANGTYAIPSPSNWIERGLFFKSDGTKMYLATNENILNAPSRVYEYNLSTAWDITTASFDSYLSTSNQDDYPTGLAFKTDGTIFYLLGSQNKTVYQYTLSTAWDISTASYASKSYSVTAQETSLKSLVFNDDGTKMYVAGSVEDTVYEYDLSTAWDVSTTSYSGSSHDFNVSGGITSPTGMYFKPNGEELFVLCGNTDAVYKYDTGENYTITVPASVQNPPRAALGKLNRITYDFYTADGGTNVYLIGEEVT